jgi:hypothetical protein
MSQWTVSGCLTTQFGTRRKRRMTHRKVEAAMTRSYITVDWPGATRPEKAKALAIIDAVMRAAGVTPEEAAVSALGRENEGLDIYGKPARGPDLGPEENDAADLWDGLSVIVAVAMGWDVGDPIRAQCLDIRLEDAAKPNVSRPNINNISRPEASKRTDSLRAALFVQ